MWAMMVMVAMVQMMAAVDVAVARVDPHKEDDGTSPCEAMANLTS